MGTASTVPGWASLPCMGRARGCLSLLGFHRLALGNPDCPLPPFHGSSHSLCWNMNVWLLKEATAHISNTYPQMSSGKQVQPGRVTSFRTGCRSHRPRPEPTHPLFSLVPCSSSIHILSQSQAFHILFPPSGSGLLVLLILV